MRRLRHALLAVILTVSAASMAANQKLDHLILSANGRRFTVKEPEGWRADVRGASQFEGNVAFYRSTETIDTAVALIVVKVSGKEDDNTAADLAADMDEYRAKYPGVQFTDIQAPHPRYRVFPKLFSLPGRFYEYVVYVNPGKNERFLFSVAMNIGRPATPAEMAAFQAVVSSLTSLGGATTDQR